MSITKEAMDGYAMSYSGDQLLDNSDGDWILAFKETVLICLKIQAYIRLVKVGPKDPNLPDMSQQEWLKK